MSQRNSSRVAAFAATALVAGIGMLSAASPAWAGAGTLTTVVTPMSPNVTYSTTGTRPLVTYIGYTVTVANAGGNTINNIRFTATAAVSDAAEKATFSSVEGATCTTTSADLTAIECTIGQLQAGQGFPTFALFFKTPVKATNGVADVDGADAIAVSGVTYYAEGTGGPNSVPQNSTNIWAATNPVVLGTFNPLRVKSSVPKAGGNFFTGDGVSTTADKFTTSVAVPSAPTYTSLAEILESELSITEGCTNFTPCYQSEITIPGQFEYLSIVLRQDQSSIKPGVKIGSVLIKYVGADWPTPGIYLSACPSLTTPLSDRPCIASSKYYKNRGVAGWTSDLDGDFEWTIITKKNGGYKVQ